MRSRKPFIIFWPVYFDAKKTRAEGRRISKKFAIERMSTDSLFKAARQLGYNAQLEMDYHYPRTWWDDPGRVLIDIKGKKKNKVMLEIAREIKKMQTKN